MSDQGERRENMKENKKLISYASKKIAVHCSNKCILASL
jgi:hypothetical protein